MLAYALSFVLSAADGGHEVLALLDRQAQAWSRGDVAAFCSIYADDAVFVSPSGVTKGRAEVLARMGKLTLTPLDVRAGADTVSVAAKWTLEYPGKQPATGHTVVVFRKLDGQWRIVHDASM